MKKYAIPGFVFAVAVGGAPSAHAHFNLIAPPSSTAQNAVGDPQKTGPCPTGTATNMVTTVKAGDTIKVRINETISHGGHFRFSLGNPADMKDPVVTGANCRMAAIETTPKMPTLLDGALVHDAGPSKMWEQDVKVPENFSCEKCTLQVLQFMNMHSTPCFYYHCATVTVTAAASTPDAGTPDAGKSDAVVIDMGSSSGGASGGGSGGVSGGSGGTSGGSGGSAGSAGSGGSSASTGGTSGGSSGGSSGSARGGSSGSSGGSSGSAPAGGGSSGGCSFAAGTPGAAGLFGVLAGLLAVTRRRRRS